jgi:hypothetical protein
MEILLENDIQTYDSLLLAIEEEYVEGVELLLEHEERVWHQGTPHSWEVSSHCKHFSIYVFLKRLSHSQISTKYLQKIILILCAGIATNQLSA